MPASVAGSSNVRCCTAALDAESVESGAVAVSGWLAEGAATDAGEAALVPGEGDNPIETVGMAAVAPDVAPGESAAGTAAGAAEPVLSTVAVLRSQHAAPRRLGSCVTDRCRRSACCTELPLESPLACTVVCELWAGMTAMRLDASKPTSGPGPTHRRRRKAWRSGSAPPCVPGCRLQRESGAPDQTTDQPCLQFDGAVLGRGAASGPRQPGSQPAKAHGRRAGELPQPSFAASASASAILSARVVRAHAALTALERGDLSVEPVQIGSQPLVVGCETLA